MGRIDQYPSSLLTQPDPWLTYTPQLDQGATTNIAKTVTYARYRRRMMEGS